MPMMRWKELEFAKAAACKVWKEEELHFPTKKLE